MQVVVIGGGAAGIMAAITAARQNNKVILIEKTKSLANKLKITGKGRCNVTFAGDIDDFDSNIKTNNKFMYSSFMSFTNKDMVDYLNLLGVETKVERGGRVFPMSDRSQDIIDALKKELKKYNVEIRYNTSLEDLVIEDGRLVAIKTNNESICADKFILCSGGASYKATGSTGECFDILKKYGHNIITLRGGLVPLKSDDIACKELQGLTLKNVSLKIYDDKKEVYSQFGEMLFAHFGLTGPIVLSASSVLNKIDNIDEKLKNNKIKAIIDLKSALDHDTLDRRIQRDFEKFNNKEFKNSLDELLPQKLIPVIIKRCQIDPNKKVHQITKLERERLVQSIKNLEILVSGFMPLDLAIVTCGGVDVKEVNPKTMESKKIKGLYFAGEVLDVDALTGGFNLQIAFSTAVAAGKN